MQLLAGQLCKSCGSATISTIMAKTDVIAGRRRGFFAWFGQHKVLAVFAALIVAGTLYAFGLWVVFRVQVHFEGRRFISTESEFGNLSNSIQEQFGPSASRSLEGSCSYTSVEVGMPSRSCDLDLYFIYRASNKLEAEQLSLNMTKYLRTHYRLANGVVDISDGNNLSTYRFTRNGLQCFVDYWYVQNSVLPFDVSGLSVHISSGLFTQLNCGGLAKAEYFPVTKD